MKKTDTYLTTKIPRATIRFGALRSEVTVKAFTSEGLPLEQWCMLRVAEPGPWNRRKKLELDTYKSGVANEVCQILGITHRNSDTIKAGA